MEQVEHKEFDACVDKPRVTDYKFEEMCGAIAPSDMPKKVLYNNTSVQDQDIPREPSTGYACTCFAGSHTVNELNYIEGSGIETRGEVLWGDALSRGAVLNKGWYLQALLDMLRELEYISGYSVTKTLDEMRQALAMKQIIYTGSNRCNWVETRKTFNFTPGTSYGHAFAIFGYDDELRVFIARNSYGEGEYDKGYFYISYDHIGYLFTCYAVVDTENADLVLKHKQLMDEQTLKTIERLGIMRLERLDDNITRREVALMIGRALTVMGHVSDEA